jgi:hypothetical protein
MPRKDYDDIKEDFSKFVSVFRDKDTSVLKEFIDPEIRVYLSTAKDYTDGSQHSLFGVENFFKDIVETDFFHTRICNFVCRVRDDEAQQSAHVVCQVGRYNDEVKYFCFNAMFSNHWQKQNGTWKMNEMRMDLLKEKGNFEEFEDQWHFEDKKAVWYEGVHFPCISGEFDSPWFRIKDAEDLLSDEEKCYEVMARYAFGIDHLAFDEVLQATSEDVIADIEPWGSMDKRSWIVFLKYHRQKERHWGHCVIPASIKMEGNEAHMKMYRMMGHRQRQHPYVYSNENVDIEHACAFYDVKLIKIGNEWKIKRCNYYLGLIELGEYKEESRII